MPIVIGNQELVKEKQDLTRELCSLEEKEDEQSVSRVKAIKDRILNINTGLSSMKEEKINEEVSKNMVKEKGKETQHSEVCAFQKTCKAMYADFQNAKKENHEKYWDAAKQIKSSKDKKEKAEYKAIKKEAVVTGNALRGLKKELVSIIKDVKLMKKKEKLSTTDDKRLAEAKTVVAAGIASNLDRIKQKK